MADQNSSRGVHAAVVEISNPGRPGKAVAKVVQLGELGRPCVEDAPAVDERVVHVAQQQRHRAIVHAASPRRLCSRRASFLGCRHITPPTGHA
jgi:hypothetical protein